MLRSGTNSSRSAGAQLGRVTPGGSSLLARRATAVVPLLALTALLIVCNLPLLRHQEHPHWDALHFWVPAQSLVADHARAGKLVLWNPWLNGGRPDCADSQVGGFSPLAVGIGFMTGGALGGYNIYWLAIWWLGGVGLWLLGRYFGAPAWGITLAVLAFVSSGFYSGHAQHTTYIYSCSFLPWILWRLDVACRTRSLLAAAQTGALWGLSALAGYPGLTIATMLFMGIWTLGRLLLPGDGPETADPGETSRAVTWPRRFLGVVGVWIVLLAMGLAVLSPSYLTFFVEGRDYSDRVETLDRARALRSHALHPGAILTFASPYLTKLKMYHRTEIWWYTGISLVSVYVTLGCLILALGALLFRPRDPWRWLILGMAVFFLMASMGRALPLRGWLYDFLPPMRYFRHSALMRAYPIFCFTLLALFASRDLAGFAGAAVRRGWAKLAALAVVVIAAALATFHLLTSRFSDLVAPSAAARNVLLGLGFGYVLLMAALALLPRTGLRRAAVTWLIVVLSAVDAAYALRVSVPIMFGVERANRSSWTTANAAHSANLDLTDKGLMRHARITGLHTDATNLNVPGKTATFKGYDHLVSWYYNEWIKKEKLEELVTGRERIWFSTEALYAARSRELFGEFSEAVERLGAPVMIVHGEGVAEKGGRPPAEILRQLPPMRRLAVEVQRYTPNFLQFSAEVESDGWLFVTERYTAGWKVKINGEEAELHLANFLFRGLRVEKGVNQIEFRYRPLGYPWLVVLSWGAMACVFLIPPIFARWKRRR